MAHYHWEVFSHFLRCPTPRLSFGLSILLLLLLGRHCCVLAPGSQRRLLALRLLTLRIFTISPSRSLPRLVELVVRVPVRHRSVLVILGFSMENWI